MEFDEALKEAKHQMSQAIYLCESSPGVYNTGLLAAYERKSSMLSRLVYEIERCHVEIEMLKNKNKQPPTEREFQQGAKVNNQVKGITN